jgi:glycosyltransferase involved in cell wall biosynthesis
MANMGKDLKQDHISVCICTFKRPVMLAKALEGVLSQVTNDKFTFEVVVVDNDCNRSAESIVSSYQSSNYLKVIYNCEPEQNIALARNRAIQSATGNLIAFIDDDEVPERYWLVNHYKMLKEINADGILGPVIPHFDETPPKWIVKGDLCDRLRMKSGTIIQNARYTRTGNVLLSKRTLAGDEAPFDPSFGRTGGEDADFFRRKMGKGFVFVWCDEAIVYETVPPDRQKRSYFLIRAFNRGMTSACHEPFFSMSTIKSIIAVGLYTLALPVLLILGQHLFMKYLIKDCDHVSKLLAYCKLNFIEKRPDA